MGIGVKILVGIVALIIAVLVAAAFGKNEYTVEKTVIINKPSQEVFNYIKLLKNQTHYSKWVMMDPNAKMDFTGTDGTVGFVSAWDSDNKQVGKGSQTITKIDDGKRMDLDIHFIKPFNGHSTAFMSTEATGTNQTKVTWGFNGKLDYPMKVVHLVMNMEKMIGSDLQTGLDNLKGVMEKQ